MTPRRCPCGTGLGYSECCGRLHDGSAAAATAEQLMRSRYSAFEVSRFVREDGSWRYLDGVT